MTTHEIPTVWQLTVTSPSGDPLVDWLFGDFDRVVDAAVQQVDKFLGIDFLPEPAEKILTAGEQLGMSGFVQDNDSWTWSHTESDAAVEIQVREIQ